MDRALANLGGCFDLDTLLAMAMADLEDRIRPTGFFRQKSRYIRNLLTWYRDRGGARRLLAKVLTAKL